MKSTEHHKAVSVRVTDNWLGPNDSINLLKSKPGLDAKRYTVTVGKQWANDEIEKKNKRITSSRNSVPKARMRFSVENLKA